MRMSLGAVLVALVLSVPFGAAQAGNYQPPPGYQPNNQTWVQEWNQWAEQFGEQFESWIDGLLGIPDTGGGGGGSGSVAAPEIDPSEAFAALTLLAGGLAALRGRRTK